MIHHEMTLIYDILLAFLAISISILAVVLFLFCRKKPIKAEETLHQQPAAANYQRSCKLSATSYSLMDIDSATDGFNGRRIIGKGRLGTVYVAVIPGGDQLVAVKRIHPRLVLTNAGFGFSSSIKCLSLADHPNVVQIIGYSEAPGERIIVMESEGMLSLEFYMHHNPEGAALLDWTRRIKIAAGVARGIEYLHKFMAPGIVHGCIKPSNILIDVKFCAKLCDYGLQFLASRERQGMQRYVDDEYWVGKGGNNASKESDVYGFGIVLLELLSGRRNEGLIAEWALPLIKEMKFDELLDTRLVMPSDLKPLVRLAKVASACVGNSRLSRPAISQIVAILNNLEMEMCL